MEEAGAQPPLLDWRQGDIILAPFHLPIIVSHNEAKTEAQFLEAGHGIVIVSQSCDVIKSSENCPYVQVAPLVPVDEDEIPHIVRGKRPRLVITPGLDGKGLAIDLDACATVLKGALVADERIIGCPDDISQAQFGRALARHRGRFAFPNDFNSDIAKPIANWISEKYKKKSPQGDLVQSIIEVRVSTDNWEKPTFLTFHLLCDGPLPDPLPKEWLEPLDLLSKKAKSKNYPDPELVLTTFSDISAAEYRASVELDWDGLS